MSWVLKESLLVKCLDNVHGGVFKSGDTATTQKHPNFWYVECGDKKSAYDTPETLQKFWSLV